MVGFDTGREAWLSRLGNLRNVVRQEMVARQVAEAVADLLPDRPLNVLDAGCGQGTQSLLLARRGHDVRGIDASADMLTTFEDELSGEPATVRERVTLHHGDVRDLAALFGDATFDLVLCHGVLMYLDDPSPALLALAGAVRRGGVLSVVARNRDAMALRPALRRDWTLALEMFDATSYVNEIGVTARADALDDVMTRLDRLGLSTDRWYGIRAFTDGVSVDEPLPGPSDLSALLDAEERAGRTDPYRQVATLFHLVAVRR